MNLVHYFVLITTFGAEIFPISPTHTDQVVKLPMSQHCPALPNKEIVQEVQSIFTMTEWAAYS